MDSKNNFKIDLFGKLHGMSGDEIKILENDSNESSKEGKILKEIHEIFNELDAYYKGDDNRVNPRMKAVDGINDKLSHLDELVINLLKSDIKYASLRLILILNMYPETIKQVQGEYIFYRRIIHWAQKIYVWNLNQDINN